MRTNNLHPMLLCLAAVAIAGLALADGPPSSGSGAPGEGVLEEPHGPPFPTSPGGGPCEFVIDADCDEVPDTSDNCPSFFNPDQEDNDADGRGDLCDVDDDNDGIPDVGGTSGDVCPTADTCRTDLACSLSNLACTTSSECSSAVQPDSCLTILQVCVVSGQSCTSDADCPALTDVCRTSCTQSGAACSTDAECSVSACDDNCPFDANPTQVDGDDDEVGDTCDNCLTTVNTNQSDVDMDGLGDLCDADIDNDGFEQSGTLAVCSIVPNSIGIPAGPPGGPGSCLDNCPVTHNQNQWDHDGDLIGTTCDNCIAVPNADQLNVDGDDFGNVCDNCPTDNNDQTNDDDDALGNTCDNCPDDSNNSQTDTDFDGLGNACDGCPFEFDPDQRDLDGDGVGDACDPCPVDGGGFLGDSDFDGWCNSTDNCPAVPNADQADLDGDGVGDVCDCDKDNDGVNEKLEVTVGLLTGPFNIVVPVTESCFPNDPGCVPGLAILLGLGIYPSCNNALGLVLPCCFDNCPSDPNGAQTNNDGDAFGQPCDPDDGDDANPGGQPSPLIDIDGDNWPDSVDNCRFVFNSDQANFDLDVAGDACDPDADGDQVPDTVDNCLLAPNPTQIDADGDGHGDACDNCPAVANSGQWNWDLDLEGDACDADDDRITIHFPGRDTLAWQGDSGFDGWIFVQGDLATLRSQGLYVQDPELHGLAAAECGVMPGVSIRTVQPAPGEAAFFLVGGTTGAFENGFGMRADRSRRIEQEVCPLSTADAPPSPFRRRGASRRGLRR